MKRKRTNKDRKKAFDKLSWSNDSRKQRRKKTKKSASGGGPSSPPQTQSQDEDTVAASMNQCELQPDQDHASIPVTATRKVDAQTQTQQIIKHRETQTESISSNSRHTQTESDPRCETTVQGQGNTENDSPKTNEEKKADDLVSAPPDPGGDENKGTTTPSDCDAEMQEDVKSREEEQTGKDPKVSSNPKSKETKLKSYAEVASSKDSKDKTNQTAAGQEGKRHDKAAER